MKATSIDPVLAAAVNWMVLLNSGRATAADRTAFDAWLAADVQHQAAWREVSQLLQQPLQQLQVEGQRHPARIEAAKSVLVAPAVSPSRRKVLRGGLSLLALGVGATLIADRQQALQGLLADVRTGTGERLQQRLPDGSQLTLNARSAVDIAFDATHRRLLLREGGVLVDIADDAARPFEVLSPHGTVRALGTRLMVATEGDIDRVVMLEHGAELHGAGNTTQLLQEGEGAELSATGIRTLDGPQRHLAAWIDGVLDVRDAALGDVIAALDAYWPGVLRIDDAAARLRVFGVFQLADTDAVLRTLVSTLPIDIHRYGPWLTSVELRAS